jgi:hypothetical protein
MAYKAFISSTFEDLKNHRREVIDSLRKAGFFVDPMEEWTAASTEPKKFSQERIKDCDLCILLVGFRRGHIPLGGELSITQLEYQAAVTSKIEVLVFMLKECTPWPLKFDELEKDPGVRQWRSELMERSGVGFFGLEPSSIEIAPALTRWIAEKRNSSTSEESRHKRITLLRWLGRISNKCDAHFRELWRLGFGKDKIPIEYHDSLDTVARQLVNLYTQIVVELPDAFAETKPSQKKQVCFAEVFPAFKREATACFHASQMLISGFEAQSTGGSKILISFHLTYDALEVPEHLHILQLATEELILQFPIDEIEAARQTDEM